MGAAGEWDGRGIKKFCQTLSGHVEKYFTFCLRPEHPDFDPVYVSAMFLDPHFSQLLTGREEELALNFLKTKSSLCDVDSSSSGSSTISGPAASGSSSSGASNSSSSGVSNSSSSGASNSGSSAESVPGRTEGEN
jgi:hypothetical protein